MNRALFAIEGHPAAVVASGSDAPGTAPLVVKGVRDTARIDVENWHSVRYWSETLGVSEAQLLRATRTVGTLVVRLETHFAEKHGRRGRKRKQG
ncbi:MAG: DUF3606 domain-containing protein [Dokdonella sp.]